MRNNPQTVIIYHKNKQTAQYFKIPPQRFTIPQDTSQYPTIAHPKAKRHKTVDNIDIRYYTEIKDISIIDIYGVALVFGGNCSLFTV